MSVVDLNNVDPAMREEVLHLNKELAPMRCKADLFTLNRRRVLRIYHTNNEQPLEQFLAFQGCNKTVKEGHFDVYEVVGLDNVRLLFDSVTIQFVVNALEVAFDLMRVVNLIGDKNDAT